MMASQVHLAGIITERSRRMEMTVVKIDIIVACTTWTETVVVGTSMMSA